MYVEVKSNANPARKKITYFKTMKSFVIVVNSLVDLEQEFTEKYNQAQNIWSCIGVGFYTGSTKSGFHVWNTTPYHPQTNTDNKIVSTQRLRGL